MRAASHVAVVSCRVASTGAQAASMSATPESNASRNGLIARRGLTGKVPSACIESVAIPGIARLQARAEPPHAVGGRAVRERFGNDAAGRAFLDLVVANRRGGAQSAFDVLRIDDPALLRIEAPHAGVAVGLQFETHRQCVRRALVAALQLRLEL